MAMGCTDLAQLRQEATRCYREFNQRRQRARQHAARESGNVPVAVFLRPSDFEAYLQRRLAKTAAQIEAHVAVHHCQD